MKKKNAYYDLPALSIITNLLLIKHNLELKNVIKFWSISKVH